MADVRRLADYERPRRAVQVQAEPATVTDLSDTRSARAQPAALPTHGSDGIAKGRGQPPKRVRRAAPKRGPAPRPFEDEDDLPVAEPIGPGDEQPRRR